MKRFTIGVDGQPASQAALDWMASQVEAEEVAVDLVAVTVFASLDRNGDGEERTAVDAAAATLRAAGDGNLHLSTQVRRGPVTGALVEAGEDADYLVVGTDKTNALRHLVYGTIPLRVAAQSPVPVVVVPRTEPAAEGDVMLAVGALPPSPQTIDIAAEFAEEFGTSVRMVHVWSTPPMPPAPVSGANYPWQALEEAGRATLADAAEQLHERHPDVVAQTVLEEGPVIPRLTEQARTARLMVVGRTERGALPEMLQLGSTAHDVLLNPACPVVVVPQGEFD